MRVSLLSIFCFLSFAIIGQQQINVFPNFSGNVLLQAVIDNYKTATTLDYGEARDTLYSKIDAVNDTLECMYSGYKVYVTPGADPTTVVFNAPGGGINAEHGYPQSKGASGIARSDMHHLYPTRTFVNSARQSNPLLDIPDNETTTWFIGTSMQSTKPTTNINAYSEATNTKFEPREKAKGNLARSIFYFYTMYKDQADAADPIFFGIQKSTICQWHNDDPVDAAEYKRTFGIAKYQQGKANPFVLDCSLVSRLYCNNIDQACEELVRIATALAETESESDIKIYPNPSLGNIYVTGLLPKSSITIMDISGRIVYSEYVRNVDAIHQITLSSLSPGMYIIKIVSDSDAKVDFQRILVK
jgi:hypothetical protein